MVGVEFFGNFDLASAAIWAFWIFFAGLIYYIQRENQREGFPLEDDDGNPEDRLALTALPPAKTFKLPHGRGEVSVPSAENEAGHRRENLALARTSQAGGAPYVPTGDPMVDGVGPAAWAPRADHPELDGHGHVKIKRMADLPEFKISAGNDPRGMTVESGDKKAAGKVTDIWIDVPEQMVRYLEMELSSGGTRLIPITMCKVMGDRVKVRSLYAEHFAGIPQAKSRSEITLLEEEKVTAWYAGGTFYATAARSNTIF